jgi:hypothetical protein
LTLEQFDQLVRYLTRFGPMAFKVIDPSWPEEKQDALREKRAAICEAYEAFRNVELKKLHEYFDATRQQTAHWTPDWTGQIELDDEINPNKL